MYFPVREEVCKPVRRFQLEKDLIMARERLNLGLLGRSV